MFVENNSSVDIKIYYKKSGRSYTVYTDEEFDGLDISEEKKKDFKILNAKMKEMTWGLYNDIQEKSMVTNIEGERQFNYKLYKENKIKNLLIEWDARNENNEVVPINEITIGHLVPAIPEAILRAYDKISFVGEDEEKKS